MTILDFGVFIIILYSCIKGITRGFVLSFFDVISFSVAAYFTARFYPVFSAILMHTRIYEWIQKGIYESIIKTNPAAVQAASTGINPPTAKTVMDALSLPNVVKATIMRQGKYGFTGVHSMVDNLSAGISKFIINILSMIILFCVIKFALSLLAAIIDQFTKFSVLNHVNKLAGGIFGAASGIIAIYIIFAIFILFIPVRLFIPLIDLINESVLAKVFYNNNILLKWIL